MNGPDDTDVDENDDDTAPGTEGVDNAATRKGVRKQVERVKDDVRKYSDFWCAVLQTRNGREQVWNLLRDAHTFETVFATSGGLPNEQATWFEAGKQHFGLGLYHKLLSVDPEGVIQMHKDFDTRLPKPLPKGRRHG